LDHRGQRITNRALKRLERRVRLAECKFYRSARLEMTAGEPDAARCCRVKGGKQRYALANGLGLGAVVFRIYPDFVAAPDNRNCSWRATGAEHFDALQRAPGQL